MGVRRDLPRLDARCAAPDAFEMLLEVLDDAVEDWRDRGVPCWVLAVTDTPGDIGLDPLPDERG